MSQHLFEEERVLELLNVRHVDFHYASGDNIDIKSDIDSFVICAGSIEPFFCRYHCSVRLKPEKMCRSQNTKLTLYLNNRKEFRPSFPSGFNAASDRISVDRI